MVLLVVSPMAETLLDCLAVLTGILYLVVQMLALVCFVVLLALVLKKLVS